VHDEADVGLVDAEPERVRRDHGLEPAGHEAVLRELALGGRELAVIQAELELAVVPLLELRVHALGLLDGGHVDHAPSLGRVEQAAQRLVLDRVVDRAPHLEAQVGRAKPVIVHVRARACRAAHDVVAHLGRGRRREGEHRRAAERA
jgi:hypothetical protein